MFFHIPEFKVIFIWVFCLPVSSLIFSACSNYCGEYIEVKYIFAANIKQIGRPFVPTWKNLVLTSL